MGRICIVSNSHLQDLLPRCAGGQVAEDAAPKAAQAGLIQVLQGHRSTQTDCTAIEGCWSHFLPQQGAGHGSPCSDWGSWEQVGCR